MVEILLRISRNTNIHNSFTVNFSVLECLTPSVRYMPIFVNLNLSLIFVSHLAFIMQPDITDTVNSNKPSKSTPTKCPFFHIYNVASL